VVKKTKPRSRFSWTVVLLILIASPLAVAPTIVRGLSAAAWVEHYAERPTLPRPRRAAARDLVAGVERAVSNLAPLPQGSAAAVRALEIGQRTEPGDRDREAAILIYDGVRAACERARGRVIGGTGLAVVEGRAVALRDAARRAETK
jgi:hypothetical protein